MATFSITAPRINAAVLTTSLPANSWNEVTVYYPEQKADGRSRTAQVYAKKLTEGDILTWNNTAFTIKGLWLNSQQKSVSVVLSASNVMTAQQIAGIVAAFYILDASQVTYSRPIAMNSFAAFESTAGNNTGTGTEKTTGGSLDKSSKPASQINLSATETFVTVGLLVLGVVLFAKLS